MLDPQLTIGNEGVLARLLSITGMRGVGVNQIVLNLELTPPRPDSFEAAVITMSGQFEVMFGQTPPRPVGQLLSAYSAMFPTREQSRVTARVDVVAHIPPDQLDVIERERSGGDIAINLKMQGTLFRPDDYEPTPRAPRREAFLGDLLYRLRPAEWVEVLNQLGYAEGFLLQIPRLETRTSPKALAAGEQLGRAIQDLADGRFSHAVEVCRDALEIAWGEGDRNPPAGLGYKVDGLKSAGKDERFWLVRQGLWAVTNAAKHKDETTQHIEWERRDAIAAVTMLASLLQRDPPL
jgi:hypothetical protein